MTNRLLALLLLLAVPCPAAETSDLDHASTDELVAALTRTNAGVRQAAARLLIEKRDARTEEALRPLINSMSFRGFDEAKGEALWILHRLGKLPPALLAEAIATDGKPALQTNALALAAEIGRASAFAAPPAADSAALQAAVLKRVRDVRPSVRRAALRTLGVFPASEETRTLLVDLWPELADAEAQSAARAIAGKAPQDFIEAAARSTAPALLTNLVSQLASNLPPAAAARAVIFLAAQPDAADPLKRAALDALAHAPKPEAAPPWSAELAAAFRALFDAPSSVSSAALPLAGRWDKEHALREDSRKLIAGLLEKVKEDFRPEETRAQFVASLLTVRRLDTNILPSISRLLTGSEPAALTRKVIEALGATSEPDAGRMLTHALTNLPPALHDAAFNQLLGRADWSLTLLDALQSGELKPALVPAPLRQRLREHNDKAVSARAAEVLKSLPEPEPKEKEKDDTDKAKDDAKKDEPKKPKPVS